MNATEKLYYQDQNLLKCSANVISCEKAEDGTYIVVTDKTCFFPEGGGQASDLGFMNSANVLDVQEKNGILTHKVDAEFNVGDTVELAVDENRRNDHCCQHSGEHILSGVAKKLFGAVNVGFHMADAYSTLDFDIPLTDEQLVELENAANKAVRANTRIYTETVDAEKLKTLELRKKTDGLEDRASEFRIVYIDGVDSCTCCGSHCRTTGEIGIIKLTSWQKYKGGMRIWFLCAERALADYREKQSIADKLAKRFSTKQEDVLGLVIKQGDELAEVKRILKQRNLLLSELRSKQLYAQAPEVRGTRVVILTEQDAQMQDLKILAEKLTECGNVLCMLFSTTADGILYTLAATDGVTPPMNELCKTVNATIGGKGGGKPNFVQGKAPKVSDSQLAQSVEQLTAYVNSAINR